MISSIVKKPKVFEFECGDFFRNESYLNFCINQEVGNRIKEYSLGGNSVVVVNLKTGAIEHTGQMTSPALLTPVNNGQIFEEK